MATTHLPSRAPAHDEQHAHEPRGDGQPARCTEPLATSVDLRVDGVCCAYCGIDGLFVGSLDDKATPWACKLFAPSRACSEKKSEPCHGL